MNIIQIASKVVFQSGVMYKNDLGSEVWKYLEKRRSFVDDLGKNVVSCLLRCPIMGTLVCLSF